jgi:hypothetical protein
MNKVVIGLLFGILIGLLIGGIYWQDQYLKLYRRYEGATELVRYMKMK